MPNPVRNWFDQGGDAYSRYRPDYPPALAQMLAEIAPADGVALDVGCGTGQFTRQLADYFGTVVGVDPSADQIANAKPYPRVRYVVGPAEQLPIPDHDVDLITAAQAAHWFDLPCFYAEARRVARPGALLALISYGVAQMDPVLNDRFLAFYRDEVGPYWPPERRMVDEGYAGIDFPFPERPTSRLDIVREWSATDFLGYVTTWSATRRALEAGQQEMLTRFSDDVLALWGDPDQTRVISWPIVIRLGELGGA